MRVTLHIMRCWYLNIKNNFVSLQKDIIMGEKFKYPWNMRIYTFFKCTWRMLMEIGFRAKKIWRFIKLGWKDQDWDYAHMLYMEKAKLEDMAKYYATSHIAVNDWAVARDVRICSRLIDIINGVDASYALTYKEKGQWDNFKVNKLKRVNTKNWKRFNKYGQFPEWMKDEDLRIMMEDDLRIEKAWNLYCMIRQYNMRSWWN